MKNTGFAALAPAAAKLPVTLDTRGRVRTSREQRRLILDEFEHSGVSAVVAVLSRLAQTHGLPQAITLDNGPEFTGKCLHDWALKQGVKLNFTAPGKPTQNAFIESFNGKFRNECLNQHWFTTLSEARCLIEAWRHEYNELRPHSSLGRIPPNRFASQLQNHQPQITNFSLTPA